MEALRKKSDLYLCNQRHKLSKMRRKLNYELHKIIKGTIVHKNLNAKTKETWKKNQKKIVTMK